MGVNSKTEWKTETFNPWIGCTKVSPGCAHCYAETIAKFRGWAEWGRGKPRRRTSSNLWKGPIKWNEQAREQRKRKCVLCASLADVFDAEIEPQWRSDLWELVRKTPFLNWMILTKRPENFTKMLPEDWGAGWPNVCLMTSVEDQLRTSRVEMLTRTPAYFRALSVEPLLGPVKLKPAWLEKLDWVIVGGESGGNARPMHPDWARALREQCAEAKVKFLFKQWGCWTPDEEMANRNMVNVAHFANAATTNPTLLGKMNVKNRRQFKSVTQGGAWMYRTSKKAAGNKLDGRRHLEHPFGERISKSEITVPLDAAERRELDDCESTMREGLTSLKRAAISTARSV
jgi:protein gp37